MANSMDNLHIEKPEAEASKQNQNVTKSDVAAAIAEAERRGVAVTTKNLRDILGGRGSFTTLTKFRNDLTLFDPISLPAIREAIRALGDVIGQAQCQQLRQQLGEAETEIRQLENKSDELGKRIAELGAALKESEHAKNEVNVELTASLSVAQSDRAAVDNLKMKLMDCLERERRHREESAAEQKALRRQMSEIGQRSKAAADNQDQTPLGLA
jgi:hypothetical protein